MRILTKLNNLPLIQDNIHKITDYTVEESYDSRTQFFYRSSSDKAGPFTRDIS